MTTRKFLNRIFWRYFVVFVCPFLITLWLYPPWGSVVFNGKSYQQAELHIENLFQKTPTLKTLVADIFSTPLHLDWYKVEIKNNAQFDNPDCLRVEPTTTFFNFLKGDPRVYYSSLSETTIESGGYSNKPGHPTYYVESGESAYFIAPAWEIYSINGGLVFYKGCEIGSQRISSEKQFVFLDENAFNYDISIKPYWKSWLVQLFIIFIFWIFVLSSWFSILSWLKHKD